MWAGRILIGLPSAPETAGSFSLSLVGERAGAQERHSPGHPLASDVIEPEHLSVLPVDAPPATVLRGEPAPLDSSLKEVAEAAAADAEQQAICHALHTSRGNKSEAARHLRTDYKTLHLKMKQYAIEAGRFKEFSAS